MSARRPLSDSLRPDPAFVRNLAFDSLLWVRWNRAQAKWQIFRREHLVMTVQDEDMSYRPLDNRTIDTLRRADWFCRSPKAILDEIERENLQAEAAVDRDFDNYLAERREETRRAMAKESHNLIGAINVPKEDLKITDKYLERKRNNVYRAQTRRRRRPPPIPASVVWE